MNLVERDARGVDGITERVIGCAFNAANAFGVGFAEKIYETALALELRGHGLTVARHVGIAVRYQGVIVGEFVADLIVEESVIIELKAVSPLNPQHVAQCLNYS